MWALRLADHAHGRVTRAFFIRGFRSWPLPAPAIGVFHDPGLRIPNDERCVAVTFPAQDFKGVSAGPAERRVDGGLEIPMAEDVKTWTSPLTHAADDGLVDHGVPFIDPVTDTDGLNLHR